MSQNYTHIADLANEVEPPEDGILTRTLFNDDGVKAVIDNDRITPAGIDH